MKILRVPTTDVLSTKVKSILLVWAASSVLVLPTMYLGLRILAMANSHVTYVLYFLPFLSLALIALYSEYYSYIIKFTYGLLNKQAFQGLFFYTLLVELFLYKRKLTYYFVGLFFFVGIGLIGEHTKLVDLSRKAEQEDRKVALEEGIHASNLKLKNEKIKLEQERFLFEKTKYWHQHKAESEQLAARDTHLDLNVSDTDLVIPETATSLFGKHRSLSQQVVDTLIQSNKMSDLPDSE